jgi:hypothetical protein
VCRKNSLPEWSSSVLLWPYQPFSLQQVIVALWWALYVIWYTGWHKKRELLTNPTKIEEIQKKKLIDRNWTITTCLLRDSNPNYQCLKITSCRWRRPPLMHSFTTTTHFKSSCSAECDYATHTGWHKRTGIFEMRSGSERMHTWRRTPSTWRNFQTLIIWITVS